MKKVIFITLLIMSSITNVKADLPLPNVFAGGGVAMQAFANARQAEADDLKNQMLREQIAMIQQQRKIMEMQAQAIHYRQHNNRHAKSKISQTYAEGLTLFTTEVPAQNHCPNDTVVWLNLSTGVWHAKGGRWYGNTKNGSYVCKNEALVVGYRGSLNRQ